ncbi:LysR family transcriptional regulator [Acinetobacter populi]|uniref:LysR family transcriptional regulator n=1 Tax=Acinetobacter populi TaxID=1582270 RepID=A0A1Z9YU76_9GAMM|nr:LysR family transcriptional regulator [Acinetobacter populi]OUY05770.1 LysR family transcriptional regulator [Acinetobacter populi]
MDKFETLQLFTRIVELGSFSRAADQLGIPRATASNAIKQLEKNLQSRLLERTTRYVRTSQDGQAFYERCTQILSELEDAESSLKNVITRPYGRLRVDLSGAQATRIVLPHIDDFHRSYPEIELVISSGDRLVDLVREGIDCVIRAGHLEDSSLVAKHLVDVPQVICASPDYLEQYGIPQHPKELNQHYCVNFFSVTGGRYYPIELQENGKIQDYFLKSWIAVNDAENYVLCALRNMGLIQVPRYHVLDQLKNGQLIEVLLSWKSPDMSISVLYPQHRQLSPRVSVFVEWLSRLYGNFL